MKIYNIRNYLALIINTIETIYHKTYNYIFITDLMYLLFLNTKETQDI